MRSSATSSSTKPTSNECVRRSGASRPVSAVDRITGEDDATRLAAARSGDEDAFRRLTDPLRPELLVHCYRMLGSFEDAEDALQETWLRAWRRLSTFEGRATL